MKQASSAGAQIGALQWLLGVVEQATGLPHSDILGHTLEELGFDSLSCLQLSHKLQQAFPDKTSFHMPGHVVVSDIFESVRDANRLSSHSGTRSDAGAGAGAFKTKPAKKWLALHGFRMNSQIFRYQLENIINEVESMQSQQAGDQSQTFAMRNTDFPNAPLPALGSGEEGLEDLYVSIITSSASSSSSSVSSRAGVTMPLYEWWRSGVEGEGYDTAWIGSDGLDRSFEWLRAQVQSEQYAGVIGMSQGAGMAYLLVLSGAVPRGLLFSPVGPSNCKGHVHKMLQSSEAPAMAPTFNYPLLVVWDLTDTPSEDFIRDVIKEGPLAVQEVHHDGGHVVPQDVSQGKYARRRYVVDAIAKWLA
jgi:hypothetical protein